MKKGLSVLLAAAMLLTVLAGCGSSDSTAASSAADTTSAAEPAAAAETTAAETAAGEETVTADSAVEQLSSSDVNGTVVMGLVSSWDNLLPYTNSTYYSSLIISLLYDKLVYVAADGSIQPRGADSWEVSDDGKTLTFHLNENAVFHDGEPVTAEDWVFSLQLLSKADVSAVFTDQSLLADIEGTDDAGVETSENSIAAEAVDDYTLAITFKNEIDVDSYLKSKSYYLTVLPKHLLEDQNAADVASWDFWNAPVGSGPCAFNALSADGTELTLDRFTDYYQGNANWTTLIIRQTDATAMSSALLTGELDVVYTPVGNDEAIAMQNMDGADKLTFDMTDDLVYVYTIAVNNTIIDDVRVRQAINYAIDRQAIADFLTGDYGETIGEPMQLYLTEDNASYPQDIQPEYDLDKAKELLEEAEADGYDGHFTLAAPEAGQRADMAVLIGQFLEEAGFDVELVTIDAATMMSDLKAGADGTYDGGIIVYGISSDPMVRNDIYTTASVTVLALQDTTYEEKQAAIAAETDEAKKAELIEDYFEYLDEQQAAIWLAGKRQVYVYNSRLGSIMDSLVTIANRNTDVWNWVLSE